MRIGRKLRTKTVEDSALVLLGNFISQVMSLFVVAVVSRVLSVAEYGVYCILNSISTFVTDIADMGMNGALTRFVAEYRAKGRAEDEKQLICYSMRRKLMNLVVVFIVLVIGAKTIAEYWLHDGELYYYIYFVIFTCAFALFVAALRAILQGRQEFRKYFVTVVIWNGVWSGSIFLMALIGRLSALSSIIAGAVSGIINLVLCVRLVGIDVKDIIKVKKIDNDVKKKFNNFGNWMMLWALFAVLQSKLDVFMLATLTTSVEVSYYDIASKVTRPVLMVVSSYAQVLNPQFASIHKSELKKHIVRIAKFIAAISAMIIVGIGMVQPVVSIIFGHKYDSSIIPAQLLLFAIIFYVWTVPFNSALYALNKPHVFTIAAFAGLVVTAIGNGLLLEEYGAIGAAVTYIAAQIIGLIVAVVAFVKIMKEEKL